MSKVKNYYWDQAEDYIDSLVSKITSNNMTVEEAVAEAKTTDHNFQLCGIHSMDDLEECLYNEVS
tara:strand:+ start:719 stop:913 length:195 start_codon:yes stop_codon:yes gene_type:complete